MAGNRPSGRRAAGAFGFMLRLLPVLPVAALALFLVREHREERQRWEEQQAREAVAAKERGSELAQSAFGAVWQRCRDDWRQALSVYQEPVAFAWTRQGLDGYVREGADPVSWRQLRCDARGNSTTSVMSSGTNAA